MKIIFAIKSMTISGGAERVLAEISNKLFGLGHEVSILSFDKKNDQSFYKIDKGIKEIKLGDEFSDKKILTLDLFKRIYLLRKQIKFCKSGVVVGFNYSIYFPLVISSIGLKIKLICSEHSTYKSFKKNFLALILLKFIPFFQVKFIMVSLYAFNSFPKRIQKISEVIENPISVRPEPLASLSKKRNLILSVGRLSPEKNHLRLIEAFSKISNKYPSWKLKIIGSGPLEEEIKKFILKKKVENKIFLKKEVINIVEEYAQAKFSVLSSEYEGFSLVTAESLACGLPVILFEDSNVLGLVKNMENGISIKNSESNTLNLSIEMEKLISNEKLLFELSKKSKIPETYDINLVIEKWNRILKNSFLKKKTT